MQALAYWSYHPQNLLCTLCVYLIFSFTHTHVSTLFIMSDGKEEKRKVKQTNKAKQHVQHTQRQSLFLENVQVGTTDCGLWCLW